MSDEDVGDYCRQVEDCLTRVNGGHLVRIVGPGFEVVRRWAIDGIPLSVVCRGIELKAERHRTGKSKRPLRIEFCEADVRAVFENWRRAVGLTLGGRTDDATADVDQPAEPKRQPSLARQIDRAVERLVRAAGRLDLPESLRDELNRLLEEVTTLAPAAKRARGEARAEIVARLAELDRALADRTRSSAPVELVGQLRDEAERDLAPYQGRLAPSAWRHAVDVTADRLLRHRFGLPSLDSR